MNIKNINLKIFYIFFKLGQYDEAIKCYDEIITKLDPKDASVWNAKGITLYHLGQREGAIQCFDEVLTKLDLKDKYALNCKGWILDNLEISRSHRIF